MIILGSTCLPGWILNPDASKCYKYSDSVTSWWKAKEECELPISVPDDSVVLSQHKAHLVSIANKEENNFVSSLVNGKIAWLGGTKLWDETWLWIDGSVWSYENWRYSPEGLQLEPNNYNNNENSLVMNCGGLTGGEWCDFHGNTPQPSGYVCQYIAF